jgi:hypothetical protein
MLSSRGEVTALSSAHLPLKLRRAIGWIAIYALALQSILGATASRPAFALDRASGFDPAAVICLASHDGSAGQDTGRDAGQSTGPNTGQRPGDEASHRCGPCALCAPPPSLAGTQAVTALAIDRIAAQPGTVWRPVVSAFSRIALPPGGPRAPPLIG